MVNEEDAEWQTECEFCGETFDSEERLREHKAREHEASKDEQEMQQSAEQRQQQQDPE